MRAGWLLGVVLGLGAPACGFGDNSGAQQQHELHKCGDGTVDPAEGCDDGNTVSDDGCSATCEVEVPNPVCGNGVKETGEACDDGNTVVNDGCSATCTTEVLCGNGHVDDGEQCDDGNTTSGDGCSSVCHTETATACTLIPQGGCSGATPACDLTAADDGTTECRGVTKQGNSDSICAAATECRAGYTCLDSDPIGTKSWCYRYCAADGDCTSTGTGSRCVFDLTDDNGNSLNVKVCSNSCDPYNQTGCPTGTGCLAYDETGGDITDCAIMGTKLDGQSCAADTECLPGSACISAGGVAKCRSYCKVGVSGTCGSSQQCVSFADKINLGTVEIGACL